MQAAVAPLVLASASSGRLRVLHGAGIYPQVVVSGVDETVTDALDTPAVVGVLAERKAAAVAARFPDALVLGCDSLLQLNRTTFGQPGSPAAAPFVDGIDGAASNVIGLSLPLLRRMLADLGVAITDLWRRPA